MYGRLLSGWYLLVMYIHVLPVAKPSHGAFKEFRVCSAAERELLLGGTL